VTPRRPIGFVPSLLLWALALLCIAGIVHIASILMMPRVASRDAFARISAVAPVNQMTLLPATLPGAEVAPFEDPAMAVGACRFDLTRGPVRIRASLPPEALLLMSFHGRYGQLFYAMTDRGASRGRLEVVLATRDQLDDIESRDSDEELPQELRLQAPTLQGFFVARALAERPSLMAEAQARITSIVCELAPKPAG
jgi:uncharacterized membrane protein